MSRRHPAGNLDWDPALKKKFLLTGYESELQHIKP